MKNGERNWLAIERIKNKDLMSRREVQQKARDAVEFQKDAVKGPFTWREPQKKRRFWS
jgi:hypothetical protein